MTNRFRISGTFARRLEELGLPPAVVLRHAGLPAALFDQERIQVTTEEMFAVHRALQELSGDPAIGLKLGSEERIERYDPIAIAALHTRTLREAIAKLARYKQLTCPEEIRVIEHADECSVRFIWLLANQPEPEALIDICFAWCVAIARRGTGHAVNPKRVEFQRAGTHRHVFEQHFRCPVTFSAADNLLVFHKADLDRTFVTHNPDLLAMVAPQLEAELAEQLATRTLKDQVKAVLKRIIAGQRPLLKDVAVELRLSTRTLQRRLTEERVTFQVLVEEARRELAQHYLRHSSLELNETAYLLGYEDSNSFFRAFHQWEGTTPAQWRNANSRGVL
jgi:AraC-like DNA-binding protein